MKLDGNKTYLVAIATIIYAAVGWYLGHLDMQEALALLSTSGLVGFLRHGVEKNGDAPRMR